MAQLINTLQPTGIPSLTPSLSSSADTSDNESSYNQNPMISQDLIHSDIIRSRSVSESVSDTGENTVKKTSTKRSWSADVSIMLGLLYIYKLRILNSKLTVCGLQVETF